MTSSALRLGAAFSLLAGLACAPPAAAPAIAILCLDIGGRALPVVCRTQASRLDPGQPIDVDPRNARGG